MSWWQAATILSKVHKMAVIPPDHYGRIRRWIVRQAQNRHPETGRYNYKGAFIFTLFLTAWCGSSAAIGIATQSFVWFYLAMAALIPVGLLFALVSKALIFRAAGWGQILEAMDLRTAQKQELEERQRNIVTR